MNWTAMALMSMGVGLGQAPAPVAPVTPIPATATTRGTLPEDIQPTRSRISKFGIDYRSEQKQFIHQIELVVSKDKGQTWETLDAVTPDKEHLNFSVKDDGVYLVNMVIVFKDGRRDPANPATDPRSEKILVDTVAPIVRMTAERRADEVSVEWGIEEKYLNEAATQVLYKASDNPIAQWIPVPVASMTKRAAKFKPPVPGPITMRIIATDYAGNSVDVTKDVPGSGVVTADSSKPTIPTPGVAVTSYTPTEVPPPSIPTRPVTLPPSVSGVAPAPSLTPVPTTPGTGWTTPVVAAPAPTLPAPTVPAPLPTTAGIGTSPTTIGSSSPTTAPSMAPASATETTSVQTQVIRSPEFDLNYEVNNGVSGISRIDLYVTRDDGRNWTRCSTHHGKEMPLRVKLNKTFDSKDGDFGLKLVSVSGVGVADDIPTAGTAPEMRIRVDTTKPHIDIFQHTPSNQPNAVQLNWSAKDDNFGPNPIGLQWGESSKGPWYSISGETANVLNAPATPTLIANTGSYTWAVPSNLPTHRVYLRVTAVDLAGNFSEAITREPIIVDLTKPRARIVKISAP
ncbi:MAG: hypothetical protein ACRC8S_09565 [Fimbriiglobus sp.]